VDDRTPSFEPDRAEAAGRKRNSSKALVFRSGEVLLTKNRDHIGEFHLLPGGGQRFGETLEQACARETREETGCLVEAVRLVLVREYIGRNHEFRDVEGDVHQTEFVFLSRLLEEGRDGGLLRDAWQTGWQWVPVDGLAGSRIYPSVMAGLIPLIRDGSYDGPVYLGDVN
jgi:ADP-ribose pyrophosphatase YjhB (NUDIX family)